MRRLPTLVLLIALLCAGIGWASYQASAPPAASLSHFVPAGPLLYLEARDFASLLRDWNASPQRLQWVTSSNYEVFSRSRLFLRLKSAGDQFAIAAGLPPDMTFLSQVAGNQSVLALYDIGNLQFLYITHLPSAQAMQSALWQSRAKFEPRNAAGASFYVRRDPESQREVAFAVAGDYLLLATREVLMAGALQLLSGSKDRTLEAESWWTQSVAATKSTGDLRMILNLDKIVPSPYFRTYWVQQNITDLKQYSASISDLFRSGAQYREERVLLLKPAPAATPTSASPTPVAASMRDMASLARSGGLEAVADLARLAPATAAFYQANASPSADACFALLEAKILAPPLGPAPASELAPQVQLGSGGTSTGSDLETRIDQPAVPRAAAPAGSSALKDLITRTQILASLQVQSTTRDKAGVFIRIHSAVALLAAADWDDNTARSALVDLVRPSLTAGQLGLGWQKKSGYQEFDGLWPLAASVRGKYLLVSDDPSLLEAMLANFDRKPDSAPALMLAGFQHARERESYGRMFGLIDRPSLPFAKAPGGERQPQFFSENIASLSAALAAVESERIAVRLDGDKVLQTVTYVWAR